MSDPISVLVVDDHEVVRSGLIGIVERQSAMRVAGEAADGEEAVEAFRRLRPDVVLMDLKMPRMNGWEATERIRRDFPLSKILILTTLDGDADIHRALAAGAIGYLLKDTPSAMLVAAIRAAHAGLRSISPAAGSALAARQGYGELTEREMTVLQFLASGKSNKEIASDLEVSESTVKGHVSNVLLKLGASDRTAAVTIALRRGLVQL
jgi:DNA-binding NarL/FixJ family response regulator